VTNGFTVKHVRTLQLPDWNDTLLFARNEYFLLFKNYELHQFQLENEVGKSMARVNFVIFNKTALHPLLAPFGEIDFAQEIGHEGLFYFLQQIKSTAVELGWENIRIAIFPEAYNYSSYKYLEKALSASSFDRLDRQPDWIFFIQEHVAKNQIHPLDLEFAFEDEFDLKEIFDFIQSNRAKQGYEFRLGFEDFHGFFIALPEAHTLFALRKNGKIIAVLTGIIVAIDIMYAFPAAYDPEEATFDEVLFFYRSLFDLLKENGFRIFDVGTVFNDQDKLVFGQLNPIKTYKNSFQIEL